MWMPLSEGWSAPSERATFCCEAMTGALAFDRAQHEDPFACNDQLIVYNEIFDEIGILVRDGGAVVRLDPVLSLVRHASAREPARSLVRRNGSQRLYG